MLDQVRHWLQGFYALRSPMSIALAVAVPALSFVAGLLVVLGLPPDYFVRARARPTPPRAHPALRVAMRGAKNLLGVLMILAGFVMALPLVPGPGVLFMLVGLGLVDFPGKRGLELRLLRQRHVLSSVNKVRARFGKRALLTQESGGQSVVESKP